MVYAMLNSRGWTTIFHTEDDWYLTFSSWTYGSQQFQLWLNFFQMIRTDIFPEDNLEYSPISYSHLALK